MVFSIPFYMHEVIDRAAEVYPRKIFIEDETDSLSYENFIRCGTQLADELKTKYDLKMGDRLLTACENTLLVPLYLYATSRLGGIFVPLAQNFQGQRLAHILKDCSPKLIITDKKNFASRCKGYRVVLQKGFKDLYKIIKTLKPDTSVPETLIDLDTFLLIYTSGSTGMPKGVELSHSSVISATESIARYLEVKENEKIINFNPFSFDYGLYQIFITAIRGATLYINKNFIYKEKIFSFIKEKKITGIPFVPSQIVAMYDRSELKEKIFDRVNFISTTGAPFPYRHVSKLRYNFPNARLYPMYGLTECKRVSYLHPSKVDRKPTSVGRAMPNSRIRIINEKKQVVAAGETGMLVIEGRNVMQGYWNIPEGNNNVLGSIPDSRNKILFSGDYFYLDDENDLFFVGRRDDIVKSNGIRISLKDIEKILERIPEVSEAAVVAVPDEKIENTFHAFVVKKQGTEIDSDGIIQNMLKEVETRFMLPKQITLTDSIPKKTNGKIDYPLLKTMTG
ncbi:AMP-binding protein [candidate division KSB1 bacterium]|nr:AMP-binding protein [candidate division KSB1 bacterium]